MNKFCEILFSKLFGYQRSAANLGYACEIFGGLGPSGLGGDRECTYMTVHKPKLKFIFKQD
jgi:hypothetical protein